jgi:hypothetical protein
MGFIDTKYNTVLAKFTTAQDRIDFLGCGTNINTEKSNFTSVNTSLNTKMAAFAGAVLVRAGQRSGSSELFNADIDSITSGICNIIAGMKEGVIYDAIESTLDNIIGAPDCSTVTTEKTNLGNDITDASDSLDVFDIDDELSAIETSYFSKLASVTRFLSIGDSTYNTIKCCLVASGVIDTTIADLVTNINTGYASIDGGTSVKDAINTAKDTIETDMDIATSFTDFTSRITSNPVYAPGGRVC